MMRGPGADVDHGQSAECEVAPADHDTIGVAKPYRGHCSPYPAMLREGARILCLPCLSRCPPEAARASILSLMRPRWMPHWTPRLHCHVTLMPRIFMQNKASIIVDCTVTGCQASGMPHPSHHDISTTSVPLVTPIFFRMCGCS